MRTVGVPRAWYAVGLLGTVYFVAFADRLALGLLVEPIKRELHVSDTQIGLLFGVSFALTLVAFSLPFGRLADRIDRRALIAATVAGWGVLTMLSGLAHNFTELLICRIGVGIGEAGLSPAALSLIADAFPQDRRTTPVSVYLTAGIAGATGSFFVLGMLLRWIMSISPIAMPFIGALPPWRAVLILVGAPTMVLALLVLTTLPNPQRENELKGTLRAAGLYLADRFGRWGPAFVAFSLMATLSIAASAWYPTYLIRNFGLAAHQAGIIFGTAAICGGAVGSFLVPWVASLPALRRDRDAMVSVGLIVVVFGSVSFLLSALSPNIALAMMFFGIANFCFIGGINLPAVEIQQTAPPHLRGQLAAIYFMCINIGGLGLGPIVAVLLARAFFDGEYGLGKAFGAMALILGPIAGGLLLRANRTAITNADTR